MKADHAKHPTERMELPGILSEFRQALNDEIDEIEKSGQSSTLLFGGQRLEGHAPEYWYRFQVEYAPSIPADTPCKLIIGTNQFEVTTVSFEENYIIISSKEPLNKSSAALSGSFVPTDRFENLEIHKVFLQFPNLNLETKSLADRSCDLIRGSLNPHYPSRSERHGWKTAQPY